MLITLSTYSLPVIQIVLPLYLIYRIWTREYDIQADWLIHFIQLLLFLVLFFIIGRWDLVGYGLRYWLYGLYLGVLLSSFLKVIGLPFYEKKEMHWRWGQVFEIGLILAGILWAVAGLNPEPQTIDLAYPLKGGSYTVIQGGTTPILNYHGAFAEPQTYALDINQANEWGFRADGILPESPEKYAIFGDTVYSPISGTIVKTSDNVKDQEIPKMRPEKPSGNHIWIKRDSLYIVLAHLKHNSIRVKEGDKVTANQPLAQVGNTGNTSEPHLHLHAVKYSAKNPPPADSLLYGGHPVPVTFGGNFLIRNDTF